MKNIYIYSYYIGTSSFLQHLEGVCSSGLVQSVHICNRNELFLEDEQDCCRVNISLGPKSKTKQFTHCSLDRTPQCQQEKLFLLFFMWEFLTLFIFLGNHWLQLIVHSFLNLFTP